LGLLLLETGATQHRAALVGLEGHSRFRTAGGTCGASFRADPGPAAGAFSLALFAMLGIVLKLFVVEKQLFARREHEIRATIDAL